MSPGKIPARSEASFKREWAVIWYVTGAVCIAIGLLIGPRIAHARNSWLTIIIGWLVYLFSILLCRVVLMSVWRRPQALPPVLYFSIPVGSVGLGVVMLMSWLSSNLSIGRRTLIGLALAMGLLYVASLVWGIGIGLRRKQMGNFEIEDRR